MYSSITMTDHFKPRMIVTTEMARAVKDAEEAFQVEGDEDASDLSDRNNFGALNAATVQELVEGGERHSVPARIMALYEALRQKATSLLQPKPRRGFEYRPHFPATIER